MNSGKDISRVVEYWNRAQLSSLNSSTSNADPDLSAFDNAVENRRLADILVGSGAPPGACLDVGAGFGRFTSTLATKFRPVILLEPATSLYSVLERIYGQFEDVVTHPVRFEDFTTSTKFSAVIASGVLYFYDDDGMQRFLTRARSMLVPNGVLVIRDFIAAGVRIVKESAYVDGANCYYRTAGEWAALAEQGGLTLEALSASKPPLPWLRRPRVLRALKYTGCTRLLRSRFLASWMDRFSGPEVRGLPIETVFIVMRVSGTR